jgi:ubiquitin-conjugating enzyme E2 O
VERLTRLYDGMEQLDDDIWDDSGSEGYEDEYEDTWAMGEDGEWQPTAGGDGEWEDVYEHEFVEEGDVAMEVDEDVWPTDGPDQQDNGPETENAHPDSSPTHSTPAKEGPLSGSPVESARPTSLQLPEDSEHWNHFEILSEAPVDHAFYSTVPNRPSKQFMARLQKEYRILASSLPGKFIYHVVFSTSFYSLRINHRQSV